MIIPIEYVVNGIKWFVQKKFFILYFVGVKIRNYL